MKILISGATGFIGKHLVKRRLELGDTVYVIVRPTSNIDSLPKGVRLYYFTGKTAQLSAFLEEEKFDGIIHLATMYIQSHTGESIGALIDSNITFGTQLFDCATKNNVPWIINTSTFTQHFEDRDYSAVNLYSATKQAFEDIVKYYSETSNSNIATIALFDTFGEGDTRSKIMKLLIDASNSGTHLGMSPGEQIVDISPIRNVIDGYDCMIEALKNDQGSNLKGKVFALPSSERMTLKKLVNKFALILGKPIDITFGEREYRNREVMEPWTKCTSVPNWEPKQSLEDGMRAFIDSYQK